MSFLSASTMISVVLLTTLDVFQILDLKCLAKNFRKNKDFRISVEQ